MALEELGWQVLEDFDRELVDVIPDAEELLFDLSRLGKETSLSALRDVIAAKVHVPETIEAVVDVLIWTGCIGVRRPPRTFYISGVGVGVVGAVMYLICWNGLTIRCEEDPKQYGGGLWLRWEAHRVLQGRLVPLSLAIVCAAMGLSQVNVLKRDKEIVINLPAEVLFDFDRSSVQPNAARLLERIAADLREHKVRMLRVEGQR
ncbi:MAG: hypothetical protein JSR91_08665 [Proteobacteria bacterium]|nr:hypothetical protein [Pseudomonadota bacterium]